MSDETPDVEQAPVEDKPVIPDGYIEESRYKDAQAWGTKASQEASELRAQVQMYQQLLQSDDPDTRLEAAQALGFDLEPEVEDTHDDAPYLTRQEWAEWQNQQRQAERQQREQAEEQQAIEATGNYIVSELDKANIPEEDRQWIFLQAAYGDGVQQPDGTVLPDVAGAIEAFQARDKSFQQKWAKSKRTTGLMPGGGEAGTKALSADAPHHERVQHMLQKLADQE